ncbi:dynein light chain [Phytophthora cinnamomi]|uniref:dynein light chain n=1 Tax=Phytophthora cinnamomi TaxID=4785 RepID=UPI003559B196|nr:dynein light chain [Phytophthora cinnamomi]
MRSPTTVDGYLERRGRHLKSWRRRYFVFEDGMLLHKKKDDPAAKVLHEDRVFDVLYWSGRPHGLCLKLRGERLVYLTARSEDDAARWHDAIESYLTEQRRVEDLRRALCRGRLPSIRECE